MVYVLRNLLQFDLIFGRDSCQYLGKTLKPILDALKDWGTDYKSNAENI